MKKFNLVVLIVFIDQIIKTLFEYFLSKEVIIIDNFFSLNLVHNHGVAWSMLSEKLILIVFLNIISLYVIWLLEKTMDVSRVTRIAFVLIYAGALSNIIDRIFRGYVVDFIDFNIFGYDYPIFNISDTLIIIGFIMLIINIIIGEKNARNNS